MMHQAKLGFLVQGGIYVTDLLQLEAQTLEDAPANDSSADALPATSAAAVHQPLPQPEVRGLDASNLSISVEGIPGSPHARVALRLWADREGPFEATFTLVLPPHGQEVGGLAGCVG